jgi:hypothetical protein
MTLSILPVVFFVLLLLFTALQFPPLLILIGDFVSRKNICTDKSRFQVSGRKSLLSATQAFKSNDAIGSHAINESNDTWQNLDT